MLRLIFPAVVAWIGLSSPSARAETPEEAPGAVAVTEAAEAVPEAPAEPEGPGGALVEEFASLAKDRLFRNRAAAVHLVNVRTGEVAYANNADVGLVPASTAKVVTAAAALHHLGPSYRFTTDLSTDGELDGSGVLQGNLYIQGHGDPTFVVEKLWKLVYDLKLEGVERIDGDVVYDESFFGTDHELPGWDKPEDIARGPSYFPKLSALSLDFNTVSLIVGPGPEVGGPASAVLETPVGSLVEIDNQVTTGPKGSWRRVVVEREVEGTTMKLTVQGTVASDAPAARYRRTVPEPTSLFIAGFWKMLQAHGIKVDGRHRRGETPSSAELMVQHRSSTLGAILMDMNKYSNNLVAEQVLRAMGAEVHGLPGTTEKGLEAVNDYLATLGIEASSYTLLNGSGLSRQSRLKPAHLTAVLVAMAQNWQVGSEFASSLAIAGRDGTLWRRLREEPGRLRGKTGTLDGVHCLTGYLTDAIGERYAFAFLVNGLERGPYPAKRLHDRFARRAFDVGSDGVGLAEEAAP